MQEKLERERQERLRKARESAKAYEENTRTSQTDSSSDAPGMGDFYKFLNDPDVLSAFQVTSFRCTRNNTGYLIVLNTSID